MENRVITIARSYGSGGRKMGRLLAKELGYEYYDREILRIASDESGISEELFRQADEKQRIPLFRIAREVYTGEVIPPDSDNFVSNENLFRYQAKVMLGLAQLLPGGGPARTSDGRFGISTSFGGTNVRSMYSMQSLPSILVDESLGRESNVYPKRQSGHSPCHSRGCPDIGQLVARWHHHGPCRIPTWARRKR